MNKETNEVAAIRAAFELEANPNAACGLKRSRRGIYMNPSIARDWRWFLRGSLLAAAPAAAVEPKCEICKMTADRGRWCSRCLGVPEIAAAVPEGMTEPFCLLCDKSGHHTDKCWSTHGMNDARNREIFRLCHKRPASDDAKAAEIERLNAIINTPHTDDFWKAVSIEAEHQRQRWGAEGDAGKTPADWFWLVGYLAGKALHAHAAGNAEKAEHHIITTAAACANWHRAVFGKTNMRPGHEEGIEGAAIAASTKGGAGADQA